MLDTFVSCEFKVREFERFQLRLEESDSTVMYSTNVVAK